MHIFIFLYIAYFQCIYFVLHFTSDYFMSTDQMKFLVISSQEHELLNDSWTTQRINKTINALLGLFELIKLLGLSEYRIDSLASK